MKKSLILLLIVGLSVVIAGVYGIIHDQITYTISPEYYTKFKFIQFNMLSIINGKNIGSGIAPEIILSQPRVGVSIVGFLATWWMGIPIGFVLGIVGLVHSDFKKMFQVTKKAIFVTVIIGFIIGLIGLIYGELFLANTELNWWLPDNLIDRKSFISVGSMHNFSYLGGLTGLISGIIYSIKQKGKSMSILSPKTVIKLLMILVVLCFLLIRITEYGNYSSSSLFNICFGILTHWGNSGFEVYAVIISILILLSIFAIIKLNKIFLILVNLLFLACYFLNFEIFSEYFNNTFYLLTSIPFFIFSILLMSYCLFNLYIEKSSKK